LVRADEETRQLTIPGVGTLTAAVLVAAVDDSRFAADRRPLQHVSALNRAGFAGGSNS
jgi:transposase